MLRGVPEPARWKQAAPRRTLPATVLDRIVETAFPGRRVLACEPLGDGYRNANFKLLIDGAHEPIVLRIYEHDASLCRKEIDLMRLVRGRVPVPEVVYAEPDGWDGLPPFALMRWIEGVTFRDLKRAGNRGAIAQAAAAAGETLAAISSFAFPKAGWIAPGPAVSEPLLEGADPMPRFVDLCLASDPAQRRMPPDLRERTHALVWSRAPLVAEVCREPRLVHGDFNKRNLLVREQAGFWTVAAVLDWEFAVAGSPLADLGSFLRYERAARPLAEPHFSAAYVRAGGCLPRDWRRLARLVDLAALAESLSREQLPEALVPELVELISATVEDRDPLLQSRAR